MTTAHRAEALSVALIGLDAQLIHIDATAEHGPAKFELVGFPEGQSRETRIRARSALHQMGVDLRDLTLTIRATPEELPKGGFLDLPIAVAVLAAVGRIPTEGLKNIVLLGELSLTGDVRPVRGVLPSLFVAVSEGITKAVVPRDNAREAALAEETHALLAAHLGDILRHFCDGVSLESVGKMPPLPSEKAQTAPDLSDLRGMRSAKRALEIAAAGGHGILLIGPPGAGKTALARRLTSILPPPTREEALEATAIQSVAGLLGSDRGLITVRRFRAPHHTVSAVGLLGGGNPVRPGEVTLAHHGVLLLDELVEFRTSTLDSLRHTLDEGCVTVSRAQWRATLPAKPLLVGAVNPCPCGYLSQPPHLCTCTAERIRSYRARLAGPVQDLFDLKVMVPAMDVAQCLASPPGETSSVVRERVVIARGRQLARSANRKAHTNSELAAKELEEVLDAAGRRLLAQLAERLRLSPERVLRVARTIADLEGSNAILAPHVAEALQVHSLGASG